MYIEQGPTLKAKTKALPINESQISYIKNVFKVFFNYLRIARHSQSIGTERMCLSQHVL